MSTDAGCGLVVLITFGLCAAAWLTHVVTCLSYHEWGFLIAGAIVFPIALIHGVGIWFGLWH